MSTRDPFGDLAMPAQRQEPRPRFARELRGRLLTELGIDDAPTPTIDLPERTRPMRTTTTAAPTATATVVVPYLTAHDASAAIEWYAGAFGAVEQFRIVGDDGRVGHAEFHIGDAVFYLSDEHRDIGVTSPQTLGGTSASLHLTVSDVDDMFARAVDAGATAVAQPEDMAHGARHGTLVDPFGHRWMLSQHIEAVHVETMAGTRGGIWAGVFYEDALTGIRFLVDTFGFEEQLVVVGDDDRTVVHSQLRWPEGGIVQAGTYDPDNEFTHEPGEQSLYVVTADPQAVWERCRVAGLDVVREPESPDYDPEGMGFAVRDVEGNIWSFGTYGLGADTSTGA